jgi:hypothetical protein
VGDDLEQVQRHHPDRDRREDDQQRELKAIEPLSLWPDDDWRRAGGRRRGHIINAH